MKAYFSLLGDVASSKFDYNERKVATQIKPEENEGVGVSTCWVPDLECYETALLDQRGVHPVERYKTKELAFNGHNKWIRKAKYLKRVIKLGAKEYATEDEKITLVRSL